MTNESDRHAPLREALAAGPGCPPLAELLDARLSGSGPHAAELLAHAAGCAFCAAELALAAAFDATPRDAAEAEAIDAVAASLVLPTAGHAAPAQPLARVLPMAPHAAKRAREAKAGRRGGELSLGRRWAAAALLVVGLGITFEVAHRQLAPAPPPLPGRPDVLSTDVVRGGELRLEAPVGVVALAGVEQLPPFSWRAVAGAVSYRLELRDVAGELLWSGTTTANTLSAPDDLQAKLETLVTYRWNVTALDAAASAIGHSELASFRIEPPTS